MNNSTFARNSIDCERYSEGGGGIYNSGTLSVSNSTFTGNSSYGNYSCGGGGIHNDSGRC